MDALGNYWLSAPGELNLWFSGGCALTHFLEAAEAFLLVRDLFGGGVAAIEEQAVAPPAGRGRLTWAEKKKQGGP